MSCIPILLCYFIIVLKLLVESSDEEDDPTPATRLPRAKAGFIAGVSSAMDSIADSPKFRGMSIRRPPDSSWKSPDKDRYKYGGGKKKY